MSKPILGSCCRCGSYRHVRNILSVNFKGPTPGRGWGCVVCHLPPDGAMAVLCDKCLADFQALPVNTEIEAFLEYVCTGYPGTDGRTLLKTFPRVPHNHDAAYHQNERPTN